MAPSTPVVEDNEPPIITPGGTYSIDAVGIGYKIWVRRPVPGGGEEQRKAEVLSVRDKPKPLYQLPIPRAGSTSQTAEEDKREYYIHWVEFNKRLDEWVAGSRLVLSRELELPKPKKPPPAATPGGMKRTGSGTSTPTGRSGQKKNGLIRKATKGAKAQAAAAAKAQQAASTTPSTPSVMAGFSPSPSSPTTSLPPSPAPFPQLSFGRSLKRKAPDEESVDMEDAEGEDDDGEGEEDRDAEGDYVDQDMDADADADADADGDIDMDADGEADIDASMETQENGVGEADEVLGINTPAGAINVAPDPRKAPHQGFSKKQEIEKLRHSGSMTQAVHEIARVKNLNRLQIGQHEVEAWYFSPYPVEYAHLPLLYICEFCLSYFPSPKMFERHRIKCTLYHPPGNEIYREDEISFFEIDGKKQLTWCRNLSLLSKCFLDHKTLYYDVQPFLYYVMTSRDSRGCHILGYFSKEKESAEGYNVACILTLPQHQRHGYGKLLIEFSYELSKRENKLGSPEKPLSDLGLLGYKAYWGETIVELLMSGAITEDTSIDEIAHKTAITPADVMYACQALHLLKSSRNQHVICLTDAIKEQHARAMKKRKRRINPEKLKDWKPPVFSRDQLRFGW
ncbi:Histone acetyltransferase [Tulasnella sp. 419]|nr:Histone acetyltransferase [Tulasnella sp. 418]KAG8963081.1 Histone acetyltransferase [Tulasnella sp. 419]